METKTTKTVLHRRVSYRAIVDPVQNGPDSNDMDDRDRDIEVQTRQKGGDWERLAVGMFGAGGLDCGDDNAKIPTEVFERLHDLIEAVVNDEGDFESDDEV